LLGHPASPFVAEFLGRERGLRRLALIPVGELDLPGVVVADRSATVAEVRSTLDARDAERALITEGGRAVGVVLRADLGGQPDTAAVGGRLGEVALPVVSTTTPVREVLDAILTSGPTPFAAVADDGRPFTVVAIDDIATELRGGAEP
jgi:osmoprotectant transport system ATP-binding protein